MSCTYIIAIAKITVFQSCFKVVHEDRCTSAMFFFINQFMGKFQLRRRNNIKFLIDEKGLVDPLTKSIIFTPKTI